MLEQKTTIPSDIVNIFAEKGLPKNFCIMPFKNLIFNPSGNISVCRIKGTEHVVGNLKDNSIDEIWNGEYLQKWRSEFLSGQVTTCAENIKRENCNIMPENYNIWPEIDLSSHQQNLPIKFTANFNGKCNLRCVMCNIWTMENGFYDQINFWEQAQTDFFPFIKEIELLSGEPFIQKDTFRLINLISEINPQCQWSFTTNGNWQFSSTIESYLDKIIISNIIVSIDSFIPERYAQIRKDGDLLIVLRNLEKLLDYNKRRADKGLKPFIITLHFLIMRKNWDELGYVFQFIKQRGMRLNLKNLITPEELSLETLNTDEKIKLIKEIVETNTVEAIGAFNRFFSSLIYKLDPLAKAEALLTIKSKLAP
jgi:cyclic pyranopterin phosphate synthase